MSERARPLSSEERKAKALRALTDIPPLTPEFLQNCNPTWKRVLRDLVQDEEVENAVLRVMQVDWTTNRPPVGR